MKSVDESILGTTALQSQTCVTDYIILTNPGSVVNGVRTVLPSDRFCSLGIGVINSSDHLSEL